jgi:uncharacterized protein (DUF305 family)
MEHSMQGHHYRRLLLMMVLSFIAMYVLMYAMVDRFADVFNSVNQVYMAGLMAAAMLIIELLVMGGMYPNRQWNMVLVAVGAVALVGFWLAIRQQAAIGDRQFLRSMIPHHSGAILMCREAKLTDPEIRTLCESIIAGQQAEIDQMTGLLERKR